MRLFVREKADASGYRTLKVYTPPDVCNAVVTFDLPQIVGDCGKVSVSCDHLSGETFPYETTTVTCQTSDAAATCSFDVIVIDKTDREIVCPANISVESTVPVSVAFDDPVLVGPCPHGWYCSATSGDVFDVGATRVVCGSTGVAYGPLLCLFYVTVAGPVATPETAVSATEAPVVAPATEAPVTGPVTSLPNTGDGPNTTDSSWIAPVVIAGAGAAVLGRFGLRKRSDSPGED